MDGLAPTLAAGAKPAATSFDDSRNRRAIEGYESCAASYAESTAPSGEHNNSTALVRLVDALEPHSTILEIGSGPGWEADWLERQGHLVRRTDAAAAFVNFQRERGREASRLDIVADDPGGPFDAAVARYVFQHIDRAIFPRVLAKVCGSLAGNGLLLFTLREGRRDHVETGSEGSEYYVAEWRREEVVSLLARSGMQSSWSEIVEDTEGRWLSVLAKRTGK